MNDKMRYWGCPTVVIGGWVQRDTPLYKDQYDMGYREGVQEFVKYLEEHSFLCDPGNMWSFQAIDTDDLDCFAKDFLESKRGLL